MRSGFGKVGRLCASQSNDFKDPHGCNYNTMGHGFAYSDYGIYRTAAKNDSRYISPPKLYQVDLTDMYVSNSK